MAINEPTILAARKAPDSALREVSESPPRKSRECPRVIVAFRNDDPSALSELDHERAIFAMFERRGIPQTIGVVPRASLADVHDPRGVGERSLLDSPEHIAFLSGHVARVGSEIALHGYTHRTNRYSIPGRRECFEFKFLPLSEQELMIADGTRILETAFGARPVTFIPPWNRLDRNTVLACVRNGYKIISGSAYVATLDGIASFGMNSDLARFEEQFAAAMKTDRRVFLNVNFHSARIRTSEEMARLDRVLELASKARDCEVMTVAAAVDRFPNQLLLVNAAGRNIVEMPEGGGSARGKVWIYLKASRAIKHGSRLNAHQQAARKAYQAGNYEACRELTIPIDNECEKMLQMARVLALGCGCALGALALAGNAMSRIALPPLHGVFLTVVAAVGAWLAHRTVARSSRIEVLVSVMLTCAGILGAWMAGGYLKSQLGF